MARPVECAISERAGFAAGGDVWRFGGPEPVWIQGDESWVGMTGSSKRGDLKFPSRYPPQ